MTDIRNGLSLETAASVIATDMIQNHVAQFMHVIMNDKAANRSVVAAYIDGLSAVVALSIMGRQGGKNDVTENVIQRLRENIERDLKHLVRK